MDNPSPSQISPRRGALTAFSVTPGTSPEAMVALGGEKPFTSRPFAGVAFHLFGSISCAFFQQRYGFLPVRVSPSYPSKFPQIQTGITELS